MTNQDHADHMLRIWQQNKDKPPHVRMSFLPKHPSLVLSDEWTELDTAPPRLTDHPADLNGEVR